MTLKWSLRDIMNVKLKFVQNWKLDSGREYKDDDGDEEKKMQVEAETMSDTSERREVRNDTCRSGKRCHTDSHRWRDIAV